MNRLIQVLVLAVALTARPRAAHAQAQLAVADVTVTEVSSGTSAMTFTISFTDPAAAHGGVAVQFSTSNATATGGSSCGGVVDYITTTAQVTFTSSQQTRQFSIPICGDALDEDDETFYVHLFNPAGATIADADATGTIKDDDPVPDLTIADVAVREGATGTITTATFDLKLSTASGRQPSVAFATANGSAIGAGSCGGSADYVSTSGTVTFPRGVTTRYVNVNVCGDGTSDPNEQFSVNLSRATYTRIVRTQAIGTIEDPRADYAVSGITAWSKAKSSDYRFRPVKPADVREDLRRVIWNIQNALDGVDTRLTRKYCYRAYIFSDWFCQPDELVASIVGGNMNVHAQNTTIDFVLYDGDDLNSPWTLKAVDLSGGSFIVAPAYNTSKPTLKVRLRSYSNTVSAYIRTITLEGPANSTWQSAF